MGIVQKEASRATALSYIGLVLGYINKGVLFVLVLSQEEVGLVNLIIAVATLFAQFTTLGALNSIPRFFPFLRNQDRQNYGFFAYNFYTIVIGSILMVIAILLLNQVVIDAYEERSPLFVDYYYWLIPAGIGVLWYKFFDSYLRVLYKNTVSVIANDVILRVATLGLIVVHGLGWISFDYFLMFICFFQFVPMIIMGGYLFRKGEWKISRKSIQLPKRLKRIILSYSFYSYLNSLGAMVVVTIDAMMVASQVSLAATGIYTTVVFVTRALMIPYGSISRVSAPLVAQHFKDNDMAAMKLLYQKTSSVNIFIGLTLFLGVWVNRNELFGLLPDGYEAGIYVFLFLMIGRLIDVFFGLNGTILVTSKKYKYDMIFTGILFVLVIVLNLLLIPIYGMYGAAISTAIAIWVYNIARLIFVWKSFGIHPFVISQFAVFAVFFMSLGIIEFTVPDFDSLWINLIVNTLAVVLTFPLVVIIFNIEPESSSFARKLLRRIRG